MKIIVIINAIRICFQHYYFTVKTKWPSFHSLRSCRSMEFTCWRHNSSSKTDDQKKWWSQNVFVLQWRITPVLEEKYFQLCIIFCGLLISLMVHYFSKPCTLLFHLLVLSSLTVDFPMVLPLTEVMSANMMQAGRLEKRTMHFCFIQPARIWILAINMRITEV